MQVIANSETKYQHIDTTKIQKQTRRRRATMSSDASVLRIST